MSAKRKLDYTQQENQTVCSPFNSLKQTSTMSAENKILTVPCNSPVNNYCTPKTPAAVTLMKSILKNSETRKTLMEISQENETIRRISTPLSSKFDINSERSNELRKSPYVCTPKNAAAPLKKNFDVSSPSALMRQRLAITHKIEDSSEDELIENIPIVPRHKLLEGINVFAEVRDGEDNRSFGIKAVLRSMGATVHDNLNKKVTHVIFREGLPSTYQKAVQLKAHILSVLWIDAVKNARHLVPERNYPAIGLEAYHSPDCRKKMKRVKSMQPDYENKKEKLIERKLKKKRQRMSKLESLPEQDSESNSFETKQREKDDWLQPLYQLSSPVNSDSTVDFNYIPLLDRIRDKCRSNSTDNSGTEEQTPNKDPIAIKELGMKNIVVRDSFSPYFSTFRNSVTENTIDSNVHTTQNNVPNVKSVSSEIKDKKLGMSLHKHISNNCETETANKNTFDLEYNSEKNITDDEKSVSNSSDSLIKGLEPILKALNNDVNGTLRQMLLEKLGVQEISKNDCPESNKSHQETPKVVEDMFNNSKEYISNADCTSSGMNINKEKLISSRNILQSINIESISEKIVDNSNEHHKLLENNPILDDISKINHSNCIIQPKHTSENSSEFKTPLNKFIESKNNQINSNCDKIPLQQNKKNRRKTSVFNNPSCSYSVDINKTSSISEPKTKIHRRSLGSKTNNSNENTSTKNTFEKSKSTIFEQTSSISCVDSVSRSRRSTRSQLKMSLNLNNEEDLSKEDKTYPKENISTSLEHPNFNNNQNKTINSNEETSNIIVNNKNDILKKKNTNGSNEVISKTLRRRTISVITKTDDLAKSKLKNNQNTEVLGTHANSCLTDILKTKTHYLDSANSPDRTLNLVQKSFTTSTNDDCGLTSTKKIYNGVRSTRKSISYNENALQKCHEETNKSVELLKKSLKKKSIVSSCNRNRNLLKTNDTDNSKTHKYPKIVIQNQNDEQLLKSLNESTVSNKTIKKKLLPLSQMYEDTSDDEVSIPKNIMLARCPYFDDSEKKITHKKIIPKRKSLKCIRLDSDCSDEDFQTKSERAHKTQLSRSHNNKSATPSIVCTRLHSEQVIVFKQIVLKLGGFIVQNNVTELTTHLVCGEPVRTVNMLRGIARGCWILKHEWILRSLEAGNWLNEEHFELTEFSPAIKKSRIERHKLGDNFQLNVFNDCGPIYVSPLCEPKLFELEELIKLSGGNVVKTIRMAEIIIGKTNSKHDGILNLSEKWILDSIMYRTKKSMNKYILKS